MLDLIFPSRTRSPFSGKPLTRQSKDADGAPVLTVTVRGLHLFWAKTAHRVGLLAGITVGIFETYWLVRTLPSVEPIGWVLLAGAPFTAPFATRFLIGKLMEAERVITFTTKDVRIRSAFGAKIFTHDLPLRFSLIKHDREKAEAEWVEHINRKWGRRYWWFPRMRRYYNKTSHLSIDHFDQRNDLMTIYGGSTASKAVARLNACLDMTRNHGKSGQGTSFEAEGDWSRQPGAIVDLD